MNPANAHPLLLLFIAVVLVSFVSTHPAQAISTSELGDTIECKIDTTSHDIAIDVHDQSKPCDVDGYVGSTIIYEDDEVQIWNFTLAPGAMTSMHRHDHDYRFVAITPTQLEVYGESGERLFNFQAEGVLGFKVVGDFLEPIGMELPWPVPRVHAAKNIGPDLLYESNIGTSTRNGDSEAIVEKASIGVKR